MNKYTINKAFEKSFPFPIWKIEVDCTNNCIALEYRDPLTTLAFFSVIDFDGQDRGGYMATEEKEWTLEAIQNDYLILKRFGHSSPIEAGIRIIHYPTGELIYTGMEYVLQEVSEGIISARHRSIPDGLLFIIDIATGRILQQSLYKDYTCPPSHIRYPVPYNEHLPDFIQSIPFVDQLWLLPHEDIFIWAYHVEEGDKYDLNISLSTKSQLLDTKTVLRGLDRLIPQPFFQVKGYIFFLSNTKQEIVTYLV